MKNSVNEINKRRDKILKSLKHNRVLTTNDIATEFDISPSTARRDMLALEKLKKVDSFFGGIRLKDSYLNSTCDDEFSRLFLHKISIAKCAASMIEENDIIFMNASSTALMSYPFIKKNITIVTNNGLCLSLNKNPYIHLVLLGGEVTSLFGRVSTVGDFTTNNLSLTTANKCVMGVTGISHDGGITSSALNDTPTNRTMLKRCVGDKIILADHTKIGHNYSFFNFPVEDITHLITDEEADQVELDKIRNLGINVIVAPKVKTIDEDTRSIHKILNFENY